MRLVGAMVWILAEDQDLHPGARSEMQRREYLVMGRVDRVARTLVVDELLQLAPVRLFELGPQQRVPVGGLRHRRSPYGPRGGSGILEVRKCRRGERETPQVSEITETAFSLAQRQRARIDAGSSTHGVRRCRSRPRR